MNKVTSGPFLNNLVIADYYPYLAPRPYPNNAGPFDIEDPIDGGRRAGCSVQLFGVIPSPCEPSQFKLAQTATLSRSRVNGKPDRLEGKTVDDIAFGGADASQEPYRREFLGGGKAPRGYIISMADPPSMPYNQSTESVEHDVSFKSSLIGPKGEQAVNWSISIRITNGKVITNTVS